MRISIPAVLALVMLSPAVLAQSGSVYPPGWLPCPRCQTGPERTASRKSVEGRQFNPRDISGIWGNNGVELNIVVPPFTAKGKELYDATRADETPEGVAVSNSKDGMLICDPLGYPRWFAYNYGMQFVVLPDRVLQFFELGHTWRDIWTDGRKLPENPPQPRWLGTPSAGGTATRSWSNPRATTTVPGCRRIVGIADGDSRTAINCASSSVTGARAIPLWKPS